ncbi:MAG: energy transducer TonB [Terriglobia bacterium]
MRARVKRCLFAILLLLLPLVRGLAGSKKQNDHQEALQFLDKVRDLVDIQTSGSPSFQLRARVLAAPLNAGSQSAVGSLVLTWQSPSQWREEISFPGFSQVRVASQGKLWTARGTAYEPLRVYQLDQLLDIRSQWTLKSGESVKGSKDRKQNEIRMECVELRGDLEPDRDLCADIVSLVPVLSRSLVPYNPRVPSYEYGDYVAWAAKQFPRLMRAYEGKSAVVEVRAELTPAPAADASLLTPPAKAIEGDWCEDVEPPKNVASVPPHYPDREKQDRQQGVVSVYAAVHTDGTLGNLGVVRSAGPDFDAATLASVRQWRYRPAMCGAKPIPGEIVIDVTYTLSE